MQKLINNIPFYSNTEDNMHCVQACFKMVYEFFLPKDVFSFEKWDKITDYNSGLLTWSMAGLIWFKKNGFEIKNIEAFDYNQFSVNGEKYLLTFYGEEIGKTQIVNSDIKKEIAISNIFIKTVGSDTRIPCINDIKSLILNGYIVICSINANSINNREGYFAHSVVVSGFTDSTLIIQDPGLPARKDFEITVDAFNKAWAYPDETAKNLTAIKLDISSYISPKVRKGLLSKIHGRGLFAIEHIAKDEVVAKKAGYLITKAELQIIKPIGHIELQIANDLFLAPKDAKDFEKNMIFINHSCNPNVGMFGDREFVAMRDINSGEELTIDYAMIDDSDYRMSCNCGAPACRKQITGHDWKNIDLQKKYTNYFSKFLKDKFK